MKKNWTHNKKPLIALAPMDGYTDSAFRRVCKSTNKNIILFTEFVSADGIHHNAKTLLEKIKFTKSEKPIIVQLFGKNKETFISAVKKCEALGFNGIDINMGCPSKTVVKSEHGVALRKKPELAFKLVAAVVKATKLPVSVKTRLGWSNESDLIKFGQGIQKAGAQLITVHGRSYKQGYADKADFTPIYKLKSALKIKVIGNGDITDINDGLTKQKNLDGFMIGRAAIGNPWVFAHQQPTSFVNKIPTIYKHAELLFKLKGSDRAKYEVRKHLVAYIKYIPNASQYRSKLVKVETLPEIKKILNKIPKSI